MAQQKAARVGQVLDPEAKADSESGTNWIGFGYRFDRRWREGELFGFVLRRVARGQPLP